MAKNTLEIKSNPKYVTHLEKDKTQKRLEKIGKLSDYTANALAAVGGLGITAVGITGFVANISTVAHVGVIALSCTAVTGAVAMGTMAARLHADYLKTHNR